MQLFSDFQLLALAAPLLPQQVVNTNLICSLKLVAVMIMNSLMVMVMVMLMVVMMDPATVMVIMVMDPVMVMDSVTVMDFGDCGQSDGFERFDGVENLLLDENPISNDMFAPLYPGAAITICAAYCAIMTYATTNKLSYSAIENLLKLLHLLCPSSH